MAKQERTVSTTATEIEAAINAGDDRTDWERVDELSEAGLEEAIANDP